MVYLRRCHGWCRIKLLPSRRVLCTPHNHVPCHFMQSHISNVHACLAVTCCLHFWQNGRDLLLAAAVTLGWNGYRNTADVPPAAQGHLRTSHTCTVTPHQVQTQVTKTQVNLAHSSTHNTVIRSHNQTKTIN